ncbi:hypothetical protein GCM10010217_75640 [Streptomyces tubercidicus]
MAERHTATKYIERKHGHNLKKQRNSLKFESEEFSLHLPPLQLPRALHAECEVDTVVTVGISSS